MTTLTTKYESDDIIIEFQCRAEWADYGVSGSPRWRQPIVGTEEVVSVSLFGVDVPVGVLPKDVQRAMLALIDDCGLEWEE